MDSYWGHMNVMNIENPEEKFLHFQNDGSACKFFKSYFFENSTLPKD